MEYGNSYFEKGVGGDACVESGYDSDISYHCLFSYNSGDSCSNSFDRVPSESIWLSSLFGEGDADSSSLCSCAVYHRASGRLQLVGDAVGALPLYFALNTANGTFVVTSDYIAALKLGFADLSGVGAGQELVLDLQTQQVVSWRHWNPEVHESVRPTTATIGARAFGDSLLAAVVSAVRAQRRRLALTGRLGMGMLQERDPSDAGSLMLSCALESLPPSAGEQIWTYEAQPLVHSLFSGDVTLGEEELRVLEELHMGADLCIHAPTFAQIVRERWEICSLAHAQGLGAVIMFDTGVVATATNNYSYLRAAKVTLLRLFCARMNVSVVFPLAHAAVQAGIWKPKPAAGATPAPHFAGDPSHISNLLWRSLDVLRATGRCSGTSRVALDSALGPKSFAFPPPAASGGHPRLTLLQRRMQAGSADGSEVDVSSVRRRGALWRSLQTYARATASDSDPDLVVVLLATAGYSDMLANFLHHARRLCARPSAALRMASLLVVTSDSPIATLAESFGARAYVAGADPDADATTTPSPVLQTANFGSLSYQELMLFRTTLVSDLLALGLRVLVADIDTVWLRDPLAAVAAASDQYDQRHSGSSVDPPRGFDVAVTDDNGEVCGCFLVLRSTARARRFWAQVLREHGELVAFGRANAGRLDKFSDSEQKILTRLIYRGQYTDAGGDVGPLRVLLLPKVEFPSGFYFFNRKDAYSRGEALRNSSGNVYMVQGVGVDVDPFVPAGEGTASASGGDLTVAYSDNDSCSNSTCASSDPPSPVVVHNNFLVGQTMKKIRFVRHGMWRRGQQLESEAEAARQGAGGDVGGGEDLCRYDNIARWQDAFHRLRCRAHSAPAVTVVLPVHDDIVTTPASTGGEAEAKPPTAMIQIVSEGVPDSLSNATAFIENDPLTHLGYQHLLVLDVSVTIPNVVVPVTSILTDSNLAVSVDISSSESRRYYAMDRGGVNRAGEPEDHELMDRYHVLANENMWGLMYGPAGALRYEDCFPTTPNPSTHPSSLPGVNTRPDPAVPTQMQFTLRVLAFDRPASLYRLLASLLAADYSDPEQGQEPRIPVTIFVDFPADPDAAGGVQLARVLESRRVAESFRAQWPRGEVDLVFHETNQGLARQWFGAWSPAHETEAAFVLEDDTELSPLFFQWARAATTKYYMSPGADAEASAAMGGVRSQLYYHRLLLRAMREHIASNGSQNHTDVSGGRGPNFLEEFVAQTAGAPLLFGMCLQQQHLDPMHYPRRLEVRGGGRPFLHSLIGSWGPLLLPLPWVAFKEYWTWRSGVAFDRGLFEPLTESTVVNHFYRSNSRIWTPWHVRFAFETGFKCLYRANDGHEGGGGGGALITNHREAGENYRVSKGSSSALLQRATPNQSPRWLLPSMRHLMQDQYDLNGRRAGSVGATRLTSSVPSAVCIAQADGSVLSVANPLQMAAFAVDMAVRYHDHINFPSDDSRDAYVDGMGGATMVPAWINQCPRGSPAVLSELLHHWTAVVELVTSALPASAKLVHLSSRSRPVTPALPLLLAHFWTHEVVLLPPTRPVGGSDTEVLNCSQLRNELSSGTELEPAVGASVPVAVYTSRALRQRSSSDAISCRESDHRTVYRNLLGNANTLVSADRTAEDGGPSVLIIDLQDVHLREALRGVSCGSEARRVSVAETALPSYVLVLGDCIATPTELELSVALIEALLPGSDARKGGVGGEYSLVEDVCRDGTPYPWNEPEGDSSAGWVDQGASLYRLSRELYREDAHNATGTGAEGPEGVAAWRRNRYALTRRLQHHLVTRRFKYRKYQETFS